jgi:hypothetical protein
MGAQPGGYQAHQAVAPGYAPAMNRPVTSGKTYPVQNTGFNRMGSLTAHPAPPAYLPHQTNNLGTFPHGMPRIVPGNFAPSAPGFPNDMMPYPTHESIHPAFTFDYYGDGLQLPHAESAGRLFSPDREPEPFMGGPVGNAQGSELPQGHKQTPNGHH